MKIKTNSLQDYVNFVDNTTRQNTYYTRIFLIAIFVSLFLFYLLFIYLNEYTFSLDQTSKTGDFNADLIMTQDELDKMAKFMEIKSIEPKLEQSEVAKEFKKSSSTIQQ